MTLLETLRRLLHWESGHVQMDDRSTQRDAEITEAERRVERLGLFRDVHTRHVHKDQENGQ